MKWLKQKCIYKSETNLWDLEVYCKAKMSFDQEEGIWSSTGCFLSVFQLGRLRTGIMALWAISEPIDYRDGMRPRYQTQILICQHVREQFLSCGYIARSDMQEQARE